MKPFARLADGFLLSGWKSGSMSGFGEAAAILQIIGTALELTQTLWKTCRALTTAADDFHNIQLLLKDIQNHLESCRYAISRLDTTLISADQDRGLRKAFADTAATLEELRDFCSSVSAISGLIARSKWVLAQRKGVVLLMSRLKESRSATELAMSPIIMTQGSIALSQNRDIKQSVAAIMNATSDTHQVTVAIQTQINNFISQQQTSDTHSTGAQQVFVQTVATRSRPRRKLVAANTRLHPAWTMLGVSGKGITTDQQHHRDYHTAFTVFAPLTKWLTGYAMHVVLDVRRINSSPLSLKLRGGFDISRTVGSDDAFMYACATGDLRDVQQKLESGEGQISDRDEKNWTPLAHAIASGKVEVVQELLDRHADIEGKIGQLETTPLQWAIWHKQLDVTRLLLSRKASQDYINLRGWNTVFFCWSRLRTGEPEMLGFLNLLDEDDQIDLDIADTMNWTVLDRVAAVGTADEARRLMNLGAEPYRAAKPLDWTSLHQAVYWGNYGTYRELIQRFEKAVTMVDARGWTLLHIAASAGHADICRHLLSLGADVDAKSIAVEDPEVTQYMPAELHGRCCTPLEVAAAQGSDREAHFVAIVEQHHSKQAADTASNDSIWYTQSKLEAGTMLQELP